MSVATKHLSGLILAFAASACGGCGSSPPPQPMPAPMPPPMPVPPPMPMITPCDQAQSLATSTSMQARAAAEAPGMKPEGMPLCGVVAPGQVLTGPVFMLEPGYCYTFLGQSLPPVGEMEMVLQLDATQAVGSMLGPAMSGVANMAQAPLLVTQTPGERVNMAAFRGCYQAPMPGPVKLMIRARTGAGPGPVSAQVFRKKTM